MSLCQHVANMCRGLLVLPETQWGAKTTTNVSECAGIVLSRHLSPNVPGDDCETKV